MNYSLPQCEKVLVLAPHPDDEVLGCAGTLMLLRNKGVSFSLVFLTNGEKLTGESSPDIAAKRREEGSRSSELLGCTDTVFCEFPDGALSNCRDAMYDRLSTLIKDIRPDLVFAPSPVDYHRDHIAASRTALNLLNGLGSFTLAYYEVYTTLRFNCLVDISEVLQLKREMILNYRTSLYHRPELYVHATLGMNAHRSLFVEKEGYYEAFYLLQPGSDMESICDHLSYKDQRDI